MNIQRFGESPLLDVLGLRLQQQRCTVHPGRPPPILDSTPIAGFHFADTVIELNQGLHWRAQRHARCLPSNGYVELCSFWQPYGLRDGFALLIAGSPAAQQTVTPLLNQLAPAPGLWLNCGAPGAASYTAAILHALCYPLASLPLDPAFITQDLCQLWLTRHHQLLIHLYRLTLDYLDSSQTSAAPPDAMPLPGSERFADQLARHLHQTLSPLLAA